MIRLVREGALEQAQDFITPAEYEDTIQRPAGCLLQWLSGELEYKRERWTA